MGSGGLVRKVAAYLSTATTFEPVLGELWGRLAAEAAAIVLVLLIGFFRLTTVGVAFALWRSLLLNVRGGS